jgi:hypothetical protein
VFLQRNTASQVFVIPGSLRAVADGSAVTSTATITIVKDGTGASGAGTLTHISGGAYKYAPTQGETDCKIMGYVLEATGAITLAGSVRTTNADPNDAAALGLTRIDGAISSRMASYTQPTGFLTATFPTTVASTTNITAGTITTTTNLTNLPSIPSNWLTAAGIAASALNGKGDWNVGKTGYALAGAQSISSLAISGAMSIGTTLTVTGATTYTGHVSYGDGIAVAAPSTAGRAGLAITGSTSGAGLAVTGGNAGPGATIAAGGGNSDGLRITGTGIAHGLSAAGGAGAGASHGILATSGASATGDGIRAVSAAASGNGMYLAGNGAVGDGLEAVAGGGVAIRGDITGNISGGVDYLANLPSIPANWLTAAGIAAGALNGKGDWNVGKTGYALTATTGLGNQTANITGNLSGSVGSVTGAVGSVTAAVTVGTNNDKAGYSLTATTGLGNQTANITGNLSGSVGSVTGAVGSVTADVTVGTNNDKAGYSLATAPPTAAAIADAVWDEARSGHTTAGTFGLYLDAQVSTAGGGSLTEAGIAGAVWDELLYGHFADGSAGLALATASSGGVDPNILAAAVWDFLRSSLGEGSTMGQLLASYGAYKDPWVATGVTLLSPSPTVNGFTLDAGTLDGSIALPATCAVNLDAYRGRHFRVQSYNPGTGAVVLADPLPTAPPTDASFSVEFATDAARLAPDGVDAIIVDGGYNMRQAVSLIAAAECGKVDGNEANSPAFKGINTNTTRIAATTTTAGNRTAVTLSPPA